jgi:uncharacterized lipoprotein YddW (UPF0748 family)
MGGARRARIRAAALAAVLLCASLILPAARPGAIPARAAAADAEFRGVWVATVLTLNYPSKATTDPAALKSDALRILDNAKDMGFNAVFFQVRPASDALYPSSIFPWSKYLTGAQGLAPAEGFDPLAFIVEAAHERGLQLHAWLNPYRVTAEEADNANLSPGHPARLHPEWTVTYSDGRMYWNPGEPGAQQLIADGVREIVSNYDVDGIHIDDYFYPGGDFNDGAAFAAYGGGASLAEWRLSNTEATVRNMRDIVHASGKDMVFGVSPVGVWANKSTSPLGSDTRGGEAYTQKFADTRGWVKRALVDYIAPQIYWNIGFEVADYATLVDWWADVAAGTGVKLYIGQAAYRTGNTDSSSPWHGVSEIRRQLEYNRARPAVGGYIMYSYNSFTASPTLYSLIKELNGSAPAAAAPADAPASVAAAPADSPGPGDVGDVSPMAASPFPDMEGHWAAPYIEGLAANGIINGYPDGSFRPDEMVKRADFVLILSALLGLGHDGGAQPPDFADVAQDAYYAAALGAAQSAGIVTGVGDRKFDPESHITRQDLFVIAYRAFSMANQFELAASPRLLDAFSDSGDVADYAIVPLTSFIKLNFVTGDQGRLNPLKPATRAETAAVVSRFGDALGKSGGALGESGEAGEAAGPAGQ